MRCGGAGEGVICLRLLLAPVLCLPPQLSNFAFGPLCISGGRSGRVPVPILLDWHYSSMTSCSPGLEVFKVDFLMGFSFENPNTAGFTCILLTWESSSFFVSLLLPESLGIHFKLLFAEDHCSSRSGVSKLFSMFVTKGHMR